MPLWLLSAEHRAWFNAIALRFEFRIELDQKLGEQLGILPVHRVPHLRE